MSEMLSHYFCAQDAKAALPDTSALKAAIAAHPDAYNLGAQGPDFFFYDLLPVPGRHNFHIKYGSLIHGNAVDAFFTAGWRACRALAGHAREIAAAYLAGFTVHHCLDSQAHPFIYYHTGQYQHDKATRIFAYLHKYFEVLLDTAYLQNEYQMLAVDCDFKKCFAVTREALAVLEPLIIRIMRETFGVPLHPGDVTLAVRGACAVASLLADPNDRKKKCLRPIEHLVREDLALSRALYPQYTNEPLVLNLAHNPWRHPVTGEVRCESYVDLMHSAKKRAVARFENLEAIAAGDAPVTAEAIHKLYSNASYLTGLDLDMDQTMQYFDIIFLKHAHLLNGF